jgi:alpha-L-arabinofuranosidase
MIKRASHVIERLEKRTLLSNTTAVNAGAIVPNSTTIPTNMLGVNLVYWDDRLSTSQTQQMVEAAGLNEFRFPGGSAADDFHFNSSSNYGDSAADTVPQFAQFIQAVGGTGVVTLDYGSGSPQEAEAELAYLLGPATDTTSIGPGIEWNDSSSQWQTVNWKTVGYWAALRGASPVTPDDGLNFLRLHQATPFSDITCFEIGNEEYGSWEVDHHGTNLPTGGTTGGQHDPQTYVAFAQSLAAFVAADQANLPSISIGIDSGDPTGESDGNWTRGVLSDGQAIGFVPNFISDHSYMQDPGNESDSFLLNDTVSNAASVLDWSTRYSDYENLLTQTVGSSASTVRVDATEFNSVSYNPGKQTTSLVNGLFIADSLGSLLQSGYRSSYVWDLRNDYDDSNNNSSSLYGWRDAGDYGILGDPNNSSPPTTGPYVAYPSYYAEQLVSKIALTGGQAVMVSNSASGMSAYAIKESNGHLDLLVINKSPSTTLTDQFNLTGFQPGGTAQVWQYGETQDTAQSHSATGASALSSSSANLNLSGDSFSYTFPAYSMTVLDLSPAAVTSPLALVGSNYLELDATVSGQLDDWAGTTNVGTPTHTYKLSSISSITDAGTSGNDALTIDFTNGNPLAAATPGIGFNTAGISGESTGGTDSLIVAGDNHGDSYAASNGQLFISGGLGTSVFNSVPIAFSNIAAETIDAGAGPDALSVAGSTPVQYTAPAAASHPLADLSSLNIASGSKVVFASPNASRALLELNTAGSWSGQLDLRSNDMLVHGGAPALAIINSAVVTGYNRGLWTGAGITSSSAASSTHLTSLGVILNTNTISFDGVPGVATDVLVKYTYYGDANLDGKVDGSDYSLIDNGFQNHLTGWYNGDFNDDGFVNGSDYTLIDNAFNRQGTSLAASVATPAAQVATVDRMTTKPAALFSQMPITALGEGMSASWTITSGSAASQIFGPDADRRSHVSSVDALLLPVQP